MNDLTTIDAEHLAKLDALLGAVQETGGSGSRMNELKINSQSEDDNDKPLPRGSFYIKGTEQTVYAETVHFRPLSHHYQWQHFSEETKKMVSKTRLITSFREEARDTKGTLKCGKPPYKEIQDMPEEQREKYKEITIFRQVRGLVSYAGKTQDGTDVAISNEPVILMLKGSNYMSFEDDYLKKVKSSDKLYDYGIDLTASRQKNGSVTWYTFNYAPNWSDKLPITKPVYDTMTHISEMVAAENKYVDEQYTKAIRNEGDYSEAYEALSTSMDADFENDEIPF